MTEKEMIEEMADIIENAFKVYFGDNDLIEPEDFPYQAKDLAQELLKHYQPKIPEGAVVLKREEWARLRNLEINYNDAYDNFLLENAELIKRVQELEDRMAKSMLGCEFLPDCTIEELAHLLYSKQDEYDMSNPFDVAKVVVNEGYKKHKEGHIIESERGCVLNCSECGERIELYYPDGTEVRHLPYCPYCGAMWRLRDENNNKKG